MIDIFCFPVSAPNFATLYEILKISMETSLAVNISQMLHDDSQHYLEECVEKYTASRNYDVALKIAKLSGVPVNGILIAEWTHKYENLLVKDDMLDDKAVTLYIAECSEAFKKAAVTFKDATEFLVSHVSKISNATQRFYSCRIIMSWYEENLEYGQRREEIEHLMWDAYFKSESHNSIFLNSYQSTMHFIINGQKDANISRKIGIANAEKPFSRTLDEIEIESDVSNIENVVLLEEPEAIDNWRRVMNHLLELKLLVDAFRLSALFKTPPEYRYRSPACPVQIVRTCLKLAEGSCTPYELPQELRLVISSPVLQNKLSCKLFEGSFDNCFYFLVRLVESWDFRFRQNVTVISPIK